MPSALQLLEKIISEKLFSVTAPNSNLERASQFLCALSFGFLVIGLVFLIYGAHARLSHFYTKDIAALMTGIIGISISALIALVAFAVVYYQTIHMSNLHKKVSDKIKLSLSRIENELGEPIRENPKTSLVLATLLGFLFEDKLFEQHKKI
jgi:predicted membrane protein